MSQRAELAIQAVAAGPCLITVVKPAAPRAKPLGQLADMFRAVWNAAVVTYLAVPTSQSLQRANVGSRTSRRSGFPNKAAIAGHRRLLFTHKLLTSLIERLRKILESDESVMILC